MTTQAISHPNESTIIPKRLRVPVLVGWCGLSLIAVASFIWMIISAYLDPGIMAASLSFPPLPQGFKWAYWFYAVVVFTGFTTTAIFLVWQRSWDWTVILMSIFLLIFGSLGLQETDFLLLSKYPRLHVFVIGMDSISLVSMIVLLFYFPDGRRYPRWSNWVIIIVILFVVPIIYSYQGANDFLRPFQPLSFVAFLVFVLIGLLAQVFRYRNVATPEQQQQTKWVVVGLVGPIISLVLYSQLSLFKSFGDLSAFISVSNEFIQAIVNLALPFTVMVSILRYRLWDVDFIINRSLVYGTLSLILIALIGLSLFVVSLILPGGQSMLVALVVASLLFGAGFSPLQKGLRHFVDRRFYGIEVDYDQKRPPASVKEPTKSTFGNYHNLELIGRGGMGEVYKAHDEEQNKTVALKVLPAHLEAQQEYSKRFAREARTIADLDHPNIVKLYRVGANEGSPYMVMEYINGYDLSESLKEKRRLPLDDLLPLLVGVASALDYAHGQGIVHRDIKPSNVMVDSSGRAVLMDFGIARIASALTQLTGTGGMVGTMDYISPEQIQGADDLDHRADIYSLGVMTYQLLTGELPFRKNNPGALVMAHLMEPAPDACKVVPDLSKSATHAMMRAMAKKPSDRFESARDFLTSLT